ncbi:MAG: ABC transporter substrate-binding protein [Pseudonocardiaceae bacterium]
MGRSFGRLVAAVVVLVLAAAPTAAAQQPGTTTLRVASTQSVDSLNPFLAISASGAELGRLMYEFLTTYDPRTQRPVPALAESWSVSADRLTWTYTIRSGARWSDGRPITARDVAFTYNLMLRDADARTANGNFVAAFDSVTVPDDRTVVVRTRTPQATMLALDIPIVPEHVWANVDSIGDYGNDAMPVVGSGPFVLTEYVPEQFITLRANDRYWRGRPAVDEVQFVMFTNTDAAVQALRNGEVDLIGAGSTSGGMTPAQFEALAGEPDVTRNRAIGRRFFELAINPGAATREGVPIGDGHPALADVRVRQAIAAAIDRAALVRRLLDGYGQPGTSIVPPVYPAFHWSPSGTQLRQDIAAANRMLDTAGYRRGSDGVRVGPDGRELRLRLTGRGERAEDARIGQFVRGWLAELGIAVEPRMVSDSALDEMTTVGRYDLAVSGWGVNPDPDYILSRHTCDQRPGPEGRGGTTASFFCDARYEELYARQLAEFDRDRRAELVGQLQRRLADQAPTVVLFYKNALEAYRSDRFAPFQVQPDPGGVITGQNGYWGFYSARPLAAPEAPGGAAIGIGAGAVVVLAGLATFVVIRRRRAGAGERE